MSWFSFWSSTTESHLSSAGRSCPVDSWLTLLVILQRYSPPCSCMLAGRTCWATCFIYGSSVITWKTASDMGCSLFFTSCVVLPQHLLKWRLVSDPVLQMLEPPAQSPVCLVHIWSCSRADKSA